MKLVPTRRTDYALRAMIFLAHQRHALVSAPAIAKEMDLDLGYLHQVLGMLQRGGLITSQPGRSGGYALTHPADDISILDIVETTEGSLEASECALRGGPCHWDDVCALHWVWSAARQALVNELAGATLSQVVERDVALAVGTQEIPESSHRAHNMERQEESSSQS